jgi:glutamyl-Q tRNA(Asp) synthetase
MARYRQGEWLVRIEDLDPPREVPGMAEQHVADLAGFGMVSDRPVVRQSERGELYANALDRLRERGHAFACYCSRSDLAATEGIHRGCVAHPSGMNPAWRLRVPDAEVSFQDRIRGRQSESLRATCGDFVLRRSDGHWAYQLAVVVDDGEQGITEIVRGADLIDSTPRQIQLQRCLGLATPAYAHLPTVLGADGNKLSKSLASVPVDPRDPLPALRIAWSLLGQDAHVLATASSVAVAQALALAGFDPERIPTSDVSVAV